MRWISKGVAGAVCAAALAMPARAQTTASSLETLDPTVTSVLPNGLRVVARADQRAPLVAIDIRYGIGAAMDPLELPGLSGAIGYVLRAGESSHLRRGEAERIADAASVVHLERNVSVTRDSTHVTTLVSANALDLALWLEAERMGFPAGQVGIGQLSEWATSPLENLDAIAKRAVFGPGHPYFLEDLQPSETVTQSFARDWLHAWYTPANATMTVAGDVDPARVSALVQKYFGGIAGSAAPRLPDVPASPSARVVEVDAPVESPALEVAWATPGYLATDNPELDVAVRLTEARLVTSLEEHSHAENVRVSQQGMQLGSVFSIHCNVTETRWEEATLDQVEEELQKLGSGAFSDAEFLRAKRVTVRDAALSRDSLGARTFWDGEALAATGKPGYSRELFRRLQGLDRAAVAAAIARHLTTPRRVVTRVEPDPRRRKGGYAQGEPRRTFRLERPSPAAKPDDRMLYHLPDRTAFPDVPITRPVDSSSPSGVRLRVVTRSEVPLVWFQVFAPWSAALPALATQRAIPEAIALSLVEGDGLARRLTSLGIEPAFSSDPAGVSVSVGATHDAVADALRLVMTALRRPVMPRDASEELRKRLFLLSKHRVEPGRHSGRRSGEMSDLVGPYTAADPDVPTTVPFKAGQLDQVVRAAWSRKFTVSFVGPFSPEEASRALERADAGAPRAHDAPASTSNEWATKKYDFVRDAHSGKAHLVFSCVIPDSVVPQAGTATLPAFMSKVFYELRMGGGHPQGAHSPGVYASSEATGVVRLDSGSLFYLGYSVDTEGDGVGKSVHAVLDRARELEERELPWNDNRGIGRGIQDWLRNGYDSSEQELQRLYELGPSALTFYSVVGLRVSEPEVRAAVRGCFAPDSLHVEGHGPVDEAVAVLEESGYGPIAITTGW